MPNRLSMQNPGTAQTADANAPYHGCLLETKVPVAAAIAEATTRGGMVGTPPSSPPGTTPILPLSILSTSFPGIALMDYKKKGEEELDLQKDDSLRVFKRYNHWSYVSSLFFIAVPSQP